MVEELGDAAGDIETGALAEIERDYVEGVLTIEKMAEKHRTSTTRIHQLVAMHGWPRRRPQKVDVARADIIQAMLRALNRQVSELENAVDRPGEKEAAVLGRLARALDQLIKLDRAERATSERKVSRMDEARAKLAKRLAELGRL